MQRCLWCGDDPTYVAYHDTEWGVPEHDDPYQFQNQPNVLCVVLPDIIFGVLGSFFGVLGQ